MRKGKSHTHFSQFENAWLDNDRDSVDSRGRPLQKRKKPKKKITYLCPSQANATVREVFPKQCRVFLEDSGDSLLCGYRRSLIFQEGTQERTPVVVGDRVRIEQVGQDQGVVVGLAQRRNQLARFSPGRSTEKVAGHKLHILASNLDTLVIVSSVDRPEFSPGLIDRYLIAAQSEGIEVVLCINKIDLLTPEHAHPWKVYEDLGVRVFELSAKYEKGLEELRQALLHKRVVFSGHSGVGKTSLLSKLLGREVGKIGEVSESSEKGRHTTTSAVALEVPGGSIWIDTPGVREFAPVGVSSHQLKQYFPEFSMCEEEDCLHLNADCLAAKLPRHPSYLRIFDSLSHE